MESFLGDKINDPFLHLFVPLHPQPGFRASHSLMDLPCSRFPVYGSGSASGTLATDTVTLGPFSVSQTFGPSPPRFRLSHVPYRLLATDCIPRPSTSLFTGLATSTTSNLIFSPLTGIMGLGFQAIAVSKAVVRLSLSLSSFSILSAPR